MARGRRASGSPTQKKRQGRGVWGGWGCWGGDEGGGVGDGEVEWCETRGGWVGLCVVVGVEGGGEGGG